LATGLARAHHVDVEVAKQFTVAVQRLAERHATFHVFKHGLGDAGHGGFVAHANEHAQRGVQRQTGFEHDGQLGGQQQHVGPVGRPALPGFAFPERHGLGRCRGSRGWRSDH